LKIIQRSFPCIIRAKTPEKKIPYSSLVSTKGACGKKEIFFLERVVIGPRGPKKFWKKLNLPRALPFFLGATGFLGAFLLHEILESPAYSKDMVLSFKLPSSLLSLSISFLPLLPYPLPSLFLSPFPRSSAAHRYCAWSEQKPPKKD
jgi:hypothetical protein